jgi:hypothetical protein
LMQISHEIFIKTKAPIYDRLNFPPPLHFNPYPLHESKMAHDNVA